MNIRRIVLFLLLLLLVPLTAGAQGLSQQDKDRFAAIKARHDRGEQVTPEEQQFAQRFMQQQRIENALQGLSEADRQKFLAIMAKRDRGEPVTAEEKQFAQKILQAGAPNAGPGPQGLSPADRQKLQAIQAKRQRGEQLTPDEQAFAQKIMQQRGAQGQNPLQGLSESDRQKFEAIRAKRERGEPLTPEEQQFAQWVMSAERNRQSQSAAQQQEYAKAHPPRESTGLVPLPDLGKDTYKGEQGGLYPGGENTPPPAHLKAGEALARAIVPLDAQGAKSDGGKIALLSIGMSNTTQEFQAFKKMAEGDAALNPRVVIVDGAQGGQTARITANPQANFWTVVDERLKSAGVTAKQVQAVWLKQANAGPTEPFPAEAQRLKADVIATLHNLTARFPNLKIVYLSSRIYAGYASTPLNPEPHAYEGAFAMKWVIADQITGKPDLNYDPTKGQVRAPWVAWGPYLWADGTKGRKDGLTYVVGDLGPDGTHPSFSGREKVAKLLLEFLKKDSTSRGWFLK